MLVSLESTVSPIIAPAASSQALEISSAWRATQ
jgi:hypothetical protein